ncbi:MAG: hypothetical protein CMO31_06275 [Trueperaceae bacterium]|jgi:hypothetical protein|nr:hypothetical protein [Trueperaceae bacterium]|tara:strand:- start:5545 stop:6771 length:1227 start_codon:yes stop_codon:yes gene_type:complete
MLMQARGNGNYALVDPAPHWLPLYGPDGPMQATDFLRSPRELDFSLGQTERAMTAFVDEDGSQPLANVYSLQDASCDRFNETTTESQRAPRAAFWRYANYVAKRAKADQQVIGASVTQLKPLQHGWQVHLSDGCRFSTRVVLLATGLTPHLYIPRPWHVWWQHLPQEQAHHAFQLDYANGDFKDANIAILGSSNVATWEAAIKLAEAGAKVTLLSRYSNPIERQLPFAPFWFQKEFIQSFSQLSWRERKRSLKKPRIPASAMPGMAARAKAIGVRVLHHARVQYATELWGKVQLSYKTTKGMQAERFDHLVATTGASPKLRNLPYLTDAARNYKAPIIVSGIARHYPILDDAGRWKNLPPIYPLGVHALTRAGHAANTLASATLYLPLLMRTILQDAGLTDATDVSTA